jgi:hypothetical protein
LWIFWSNAEAAVGWQGPRSLRREPRGLDLVAPASLTGGSVTLPISRMDIDGKGSGSPMGIVGLILKHEPDMRPPIPIERLCAQLDIVAIEEHDSDNFEGVLVTDANKHSDS